MVAIGSSGSAFAITWDGGSKSTDNWIGGSGINSGERNWDTDSAPISTDNLIFAGLFRLTSNNNTTIDTSYAGITFDSTAGAFILTGNRITLGGNILSNSSILQTINLNLALSGNRTINTASGNITIGGVISGSGFGITKQGNSTLTLSNANTYTGNTTISAGTLALTGSGSIAAAASTISVASGATLNVSGVTGGSWTMQGTTTNVRQILTGSGGVTGSTVIGSFGTHNAGSGGVGTQAFSSGLTYSSGSIFEWDIDVNGATETHDKVTANLLAGSGAQFKILLGPGDSFSDTFWNSTRNWTATDLFGGSNATANLSSIFNSSDTQANFTANASEGNFSFTSVSGGTGNQLTWTPIPEPTSALAGILLAAGLLRRKRCQPSA